MRLSLSRCRERKFQQSFREVVAQAAEEDPAEVEEAPLQGLPLREAQPGLPDLAGVYVEKPEDQAGARLVVSPARMAAYEVPSEVRRPLHTHTHTHTHNFSSAKQAALLAYVTLAGQPGSELPC
jgi:hypothetical protein